LGSVALVGPCVCVVGVCDGLRELVSARLGQPAAHFHQYLFLRSALLLAVDGGVAFVLRPRLREHARRQLVALRSFDALYDGTIAAAFRRRRVARIDGADSLRRLAHSGPSPKRRISGGGRKLQEREGYGAAL